MFLNAPTVSTFLYAPTAAATMPYALGAGFALNMLWIEGDLPSSVGFVVFQSVCFAASEAFAALAATEGIGAAFGITAGIGFAAGVGKSLWSGATVREGEKKRKMSHQEAGVKGICYAVAFVFGGRALNNGLGAAGKLVYTPLAPYVNPGINYAWPHLQPLVNQTQPFVDFVREKTGY